MHSVGVWVGHRTLIDLELVNTVERIDAHMPESTLSNLSRHCTPCHRLLLFFYFSFRLTSESVNRCALSHNGGEGFWLRDMGSTTTATSTYEYDHDAALTSRVAILRTSFSFSVRSVIGSQVSHTTRPRSRMLFSRGCARSVSSKSF